MAGDKLDLAVRANIKHVVQQIRSSEPVMNKAVEEKTVKVVGMYYDLDTGRVETLQ
jgi:carbonic anhydrase